MMPIATSNFLVPNATLIVELVAFLIVLFVVGKFGLPVLNQRLDERAEDIRSKMEAADEAKADAAQSDAERREALEEARRHAREIVEQANRTAEQLATDAAAKRQADSEQARRAAEHEIELARQRAVEEAAEQMGDLVVEAVERILRREVDAAAHRDLIDEAVAALSAPAGSRSGPPGDPTP